MPPGNPNTTLVLPEVTVGTVINFAGNLSDSTIARNLQQAGWLPCDGRALLASDYWNLYVAIGTAHGGSNGEFNLPNLNIGRYPRGVNGDATVPRTQTKVDPDATSRVAAAAGGNTGNAVGSLQPQATGLPHTTMTTDTTGAHTHTVYHITSNDHRCLDGLSFYQAKSNSGSSNTGSAGSHTHTINQGGDSETRPASMALGFIIKSQ